MAVLRFANRMADEDRQDPHDGQHNEHFHAFIASSDQIAADQL